MSKELDPFKFLWPTIKAQAKKRLAKDYPDTDIEPTEFLTKGLFTAWKCAEAVMYPSYTVNGVPCKTESRCSGEELEKFNEQFELLELDSLLQEQGLVSLSGLEFTINASGATAIGYGYKANDETLFKITIKL